MKKIYQSLATILTMAVASVAFVACSSDDGDGGGTGGGGSLSSTIIKSNSSVFQFTVGYKFKL